MNILLVHKEELVDDRALITGKKLKHLRRILKVKIGDTIKAGIIGGKIGTGTIENISKDQAVLHIQADTRPAKRLPVHLILAIPRPIMLKRILAQAASMGIEKISLLRSKRVEKSFLDSSIIRDKNFTPYLLNGIEQAIDTVVPKVTVYRKFKPFINTVAEDDSANLKIIAHPDGKLHLNDVMQQNRPNVTTLAIGPEGGWIDYEVTRFIETGFLPFTMGQRILRVDTAVPAALSQLKLLFEQSTP